MAVAGGCMCGAVRYEASGEPTAVIHCHCLSCRRHAGALVVTLAGFRQDQVRFTKGERAVKTPKVTEVECHRTRAEEDCEGSLIGTYYARIKNPERGDLKPDAPIEARQRARGRRHE